MPSSKQWSKIGDHVELVRGKTYESRLLGLPGPVLLGLGTITPGGGFRAEKLKTYGGDAPSSLLVSPGDLYASLKGATKDGDMVGSVARLPPNIGVGRLTQDTVRLDFKVEARNPRFSQFLYWVLRTPQCRAYCGGRATGSAQVGLSREDFLAYPVPPFTDERDELAALLSALDDKIELNRKMNRTLEELAQALFKSWFIDFDGHDDLVDSEIGPVPRGWRVASVDDLSSRIAMGPFGSRLKTEFFTESGVPIIKGGNLADGFIDDGFDYVSETLADELANSVAAAGDIVFTHRGTLGQVGRIPSTARFDRYVVSQSQMFLRPDEAKVDGHWFYRWFLSVGMRELLTYTASTGVPAIGRPSTSLKKLRLIVPPRRRMADFTAIAGPLDARLWSNRQESRTLADLRDTLLPKLISGELRVPEAEELIKTAPVPSLQYAAAEADLP